MRFAHPTKKQLLFVLVGCTMTLINSLLLLILVSVCQLVPIIANMVRMTIGAQIHFCLHRNITWRKQRSGSWRQQWYRFHLTKLVSSSLNMLSFAVFVGLLNWHYMAVYLTTISLLGIFNFKSNSKYVFTKKRGEAT